MHTSRDIFPHTASQEEAMNALLTHVWQPLSEQSPGKPLDNRSLMDQPTPLEASLRVVMHRVVACEFCQQANEAIPNFTEIPAVLSDCLLSDRSDFLENSKLQQWLTIDGEIVYSSIRDPFGLFVLWTCVSRFTAEIHPLLVLRVVSLYQRCLKRQSHTLYTMTLKAIDAIEALIDRAPETMKNAVAAAFLEISIGLDMYQESSRSTEYIQKAARAQRLSIEETALVGIRTKWQSFQTAQLVVNVETGMELDHETLAEHSENLPTEVDGEKAGHDLYTRPRTKYDEEERLSTLSPLQCSILLAICSNIERENPDHDMTRERIQAYVERVLANATQSSITLAMALLVRSRIETLRTRVAQRSLLQIQQLLDDATVEKALIISDEFYLVSFPSIHQLRVEVGQRYMEQNLFKTALGYFEELQDWRNVIRCASRLEQRQSVANLAGRLLENDPTNVQLLVALGMSTNDERTLLQAWETSAHRDAEAARALAEFYVRQDNYHAAMRFFDECVRLNPIFGADWFTLGYSAMKLNDWKRAAEAFTRVCQIDSDNPLGWNNLAVCLIRSKQFRPALHALTQALKFDRHSWQMWQNHFALAVELRQINTAVCSLENLVRFGGRKVVHDEECLRGLVDEMVKSMQSGDTCEGEPSDAELHYTEILPCRSIPDEKASLPVAKPSPEFVERHAIRLEKVLGDICTNHPFHDALFMIASHFLYKRKNYSDSVAFCLGEVRALKNAEAAKDVEQRKRLLSAGNRLVHIRRRQAVKDGNEDFLADISETLKSIILLTADMLGETKEWRVLQEVSSVEAR